MKSCAIHFQVLNKNGEKGPSKLFDDLLGIAPTRDIAVDLYEKTRQTAFLESPEYQKLELDELGEPTIESLITQDTGIFDYISEASVLQDLNKKAGFVEENGTAKEMPNTNKNYRELLHKCNEWNKNSKYKNKFIAILRQAMDKLSASIVSLKGGDFTNTSAKMQYEEALNDKLTKILASWGIGIGVLDETEERLRINGVTDFDSSKKTAEGFIELIRLAKGEKGRQALPEEFAHTALEVLSGNPLVDRLINLIVKNDLAIQILGDEYDTYNTMYKGDTIKVAKEAAGKLLSEHLLQGKQIPNAGYKTLLERLINAFKALFSKFNSGEIRDAMAEANEGFAQLSKQLLSGSLDKKANLDNLKSVSGQLYQLEERLDRQKKLLEKIVNNEAKRLQIYQKRHSKDSRFVAKEENLINELNYHLLFGKSMLGVNAFLTSASSTLNSLISRLSDINSSDLSLQEKASILRDIKNYIDSYVPLMDAISDEELRISKEEDLTEEEQQAVEGLFSAVSIARGLIGKVTADYQNSAKQLFISFIEPFIGTNIKFKYDYEDLGIKAGQTMTAEQLLTMMEEDVGVYSRWLSSMADSPDALLRIIDSATKTSKQRARLKTIEYNKRIQIILAKAAKKGIKDFSWMFEKDKEGNKTGKYIPVVDEDLYNIERLGFIEGQILARRNGLITIEQQAANEAKWLEEHTIIDENGIRKPDPEQYKGEQFSKLSNDQKEIYEEFMQIKKELEDKLGSPEDTRNIVKIRKDLIERVLRSHSPKDAALQFVEATKDLFIRRSDDTIMGSTAVTAGFNNKRVETLPKYYKWINSDESMNDISEDVASTLLAYASMACDYEEMGKIVDVLEVGRDIAGEREMIVRSGGRELYEEVRGTKRRLTKKAKDNTNFINRLNDYFTMQIYGHYHADEGTFGKSKIDKGKVADFTNLLTALGTYAFNLLGGIGNIATGRVMMRTEALAGQHFKYKDLVKADLAYNKSLPGFVGEIGSRIRTNKLALFDEMFNVMQEYEQEVREVNYDRKSWFSRMFSSSALYFMNNIGEHYMQNRTALALAQSYKLIDTKNNNKEISLWEALIVVPSAVGKNGGATLKLKDGVKKLDGTDFTNEDIAEFSRKSASINNNLHGIYNQIDRNALQAKGLGRMAIMFRKWIAPSLNKRYKSARYNYDTQTMEEGYYRTAGRFLLQLAKEIRETQFNIIAAWKNTVSGLEDYEIANIKRAVTEIGQFCAICGALGIMDLNNDDDKDDRTFLANMLEYQLRRLKSEIGVLIPNPYSVATETLRIIQAPAAGVNELEHLLGLVNAINPWMWEGLSGGKDAIMKSGRYKGRSRGYKYLMEAIPMNKTIYRGMHPEDAIPFYKQ